MGLKPKMEEELVDPSCFPLAPRNLTTEAQALVMSINNKENYETTFLEEVESFRLTSVPRGTRFQKLLLYLGVPLEYEETESDGSCGPHALALGLDWVSDIEDWERDLLDRRELRQFVCSKMQEEGQTWMKEWRTRWEGGNNLALFQNDEQQGVDRALGYRNHASWTEMWTNYSEPHFWVEQEFFEAAAQVFGRDIVMSNMSSTPRGPWQIFHATPQTIPNVQSPKEPLYIGHVGLTQKKNHFGALYPITIKDRPRFADVLVRRWLKWKELPKALPAPGEDQEDGEQDAAPAPEQPKESGDTQFSDFRGSPFQYRYFICFSILCTKATRAFLGRMQTMIVDSVTPLYHMLLSLS